MSIPVPQGIDLQKGARPDDKFELWPGPHRMEVSGSPYVYQTVKWYAPGEDEPYFTVTIAGYVTRWYTGKAKIDGTRTGMLYNGELGDPSGLDKGLYVMNRWSKEMASFRVSTGKLDCYRWDNQGGI